MIFKVIALLFLFITPIFSYIICQLFRLRRFGLLFPDLTLPLIAMELVLVTSHFAIKEWLLYYVIVMSCLALAVTGLLLWKFQDFSYRRFLKFYWRLGFLVTVFFYSVFVFYLFAIQA